MRRITLGIVCALAVLPSVARAGVVVSPLSTFGGGDGWLAPGEGGYAFLGSANNERGLAYGNGHLYLVSRSGGTNIRILNPSTGADLGGLDVTGISGGTFAVNAAAVGGDGAIYVGNLTTQSATTPFKVYKWSNEVSTPTVAFNGSPLSGGRVGDSLAVTGSGGSTRLVAGFNSSPALAGNNGYAIVDPTAGTSSDITFSTTPPNAGDFSRSVAFSDASHVIGAPGLALRYTSFSGTAGTLIASPAVGAAADRLVAYAVVGGTPLLATANTADSHVNIYDMTDPTAPVLAATGNNTSGTLTANGNLVGELAWGPVVGNTATLYAMSTNQGIQAFTVSVPEPGEIAFFAVISVRLLCRRKR